MSDTYNIYQGDTALVQFAIKTPAGEPVDLSAATAVAIVVLPDVDTDTATPLIVGAASIVTANKGLVSYLFTSNDTQSYGMCPLLFVVSNNDGSSYTLPELDDMWLWIKKKGYI